MEKQIIELETSQAVLAELVDQAVSGDEVVLTRRGEPVVRL